MLNISVEEAGEGDQIYDYKMMLAEYVRQCTTLDDSTMWVELLQKARKCVGIKA